MDDVDQALVVGTPLRIAAEVAEISACREERRDAGNFRDFRRVLRALQRLDHQDQHDVVVDRLPIAAGHAAEHRRIECLATTLAAADIAGVWRLNIVSFGEEVAPARVELKVEGDKLTGNLNEIKIEGTVQDSSLKFTATRPNGSQFGTNATNTQCNNR